MICMPQTEICYSYISVDVGTEFLELICPLLESICMQTKQRTVHAYSEYGSGKRCVGA